MASPRNRRPGYSRRAQYSLFISYAILIAGVLIGGILLLISRLDRPVGKQALAQLKQVLDAYSDRNADAAEAVWKQDGEIDETYNSLFRELLTYMMEDPRTIGLCTHLLFIAKNIERSGDHATNIAEVVYHMVRAGHLANNRPKADTTSETSVPFEGRE